MQRLSPDFWDKYFEVYDVLNSTTPYSALLLQIIDLLNPEKDDRILDIGAGTGNLLVKIPRKIKRYAVDFAPEAMKRINEKDPTIICSVGDITRGLKYPDSFFNKAVINNVLYNLSHQQVCYLFKEVSRVLILGGTVVISNPKANAGVTSIFFKHLRDVGKKNILIAISDLIKYIVKLTKLLYYNKIILKKKNSMINTPDLGQFEVILKSVGLKIIYSSDKAYAGQNLLICARK